MVDILSQIQNLNRQKFGLPSEVDAIVEGQRLDAQKQLERENYLRLLAEDKVGIQPFSFLFGLDTQNPDAGIAKYVAPADVAPTGFLAKAGAGLLATLGAGLLGRRMVKNPPGQGTLGMNMYHATHRDWSGKYPDSSHTRLGVFGPGVYFGGTPSVTDGFGDIIYKFDFPDDKVKYLAEYNGVFSESKKLTKIFDNVKRNLLDGINASFANNKSEGLEFAENLFKQIENKISNQPGYSFGQFTKELDTGVSMLLGDPKVGRDATTKLLSQSGASGASFPYGWKPGNAPDASWQTGDGFVVWDRNILNKMPIQGRTKSEVVDAEFDKITFKQSMKNWMSNKFNTFKVGKQVLYGAGLTAASVVLPSAALVGLNQEWRDAWVNDPRLQGIIPLGENAPPVREYYNENVLPTINKILDPWIISDEERALAELELDQRDAYHSNIRSKLDAIAGLKSYNKAIANE